MNSDSHCKCGCKNGRCPCKVAKKYGLLLILSAVVILLDQLTKYVIRSHSGLELGAYPPEGGYEIVPGFFAIVYNRNPGAAWGMLAGQRFFLAFLAVVAVGAIYILRRKLELEKKIMQVIFGLMTGGIIGNQIDRIISGSVTDFLDLHLRNTYRWPTFNIADSAMVVAVGCFIAYSIFFQNRTGNSAVTENKDSSDKTE